MSLQALFGLFSHPAQLVNALALLFVLVGGLLLLATRLREQLMLSRLSLDQPPLTERADDITALVGALNRRFYGCGFGCLGLGLLVSVLSTTL